jgi:signal transduction histidine kinase/ActR/RegA family two-component response regulator
MTLVRLIALCVLAASLPRARAADTATAGLPPLRVFTARDTGVATMGWSAAQDRDGTMYFGCNTVVSFDGDRWRPERMDPTYLVRGLDIGPNGRIWAAGVNQVGWFDRGSRGALEYHSLVGQLPDPDLGDLWAAYALGDDSALFVTWDRVLRWDGKRFASWAFPGRHLLWSTRTARGIYVDYPPLGILRIGPDGPEVAVPAAVIGAAEVRWLDDSGPDWELLTPQGFQVIRGGRMVPRESPASAFVRLSTPTCAARLPDGTLAVGTLRGGIALVGPDGAILRTLDFRAGLPANPVYALFVDRGGALWGVGPSHIFRLGLNSGTTLYTAANGYPPGGCDSLAEAGGDIYVVSHNDVRRLGPDPAGTGAGQFVTLPLTSERFYSVLPTPQGLAVGSLGGLGLWSGGALRRVPALEEAVFRTSPSRARAGNILASLSDRVVSVDPASGAAEVVADSLPDYGDSVIDEASGRVWIGTADRGLYVATPASRRAEPAGRAFGPLPATGPAFVALLGDTVVALTEAGAYSLAPGGERFRAIAGYPGVNPTAISNPGSDDAVWVGLGPSPGGRSPRLGKISPVPGGARWTPESVEGLSDAGSLLGLRVVRSEGRDNLWMLGTEALIRARVTALADRPPPAPPLLRAWVRGDARTAALPVGGALPYSTPAIHVEYSSPDFGGRDSRRFETMLGGAEREWSPPSYEVERDLSGLREGDYDFRVRVVRDTGEEGEPAVLRFAIAPPWWRTAAARGALALTLVLGVLGLLRLRTRALRRRAAKLERMVRQRTEELERANAAKTDFVASMSHEIRNPMGGILGSALELAATPLDPGQQRLVATLQSCASFLASLVEDVLDFAAIEAGAYQVNRAAFSPRQVLEAVARMLGPRAEGGRMEVTVDPALPAQVLGDAARIQQVIVNFTANALKFGGRVIGLAARAEPGHLVFTVSDDGVGIPAEEQKSLFLRFSRLKSARNAAVPGSGLGLAVSHALAERMGGTVGCTSRPGAGSVFHLRIALEAALAGPEPAAVDGRGRRALVVEDLDYNARALGLMLGRMGFEVDYAPDGEEALRRMAPGRHAAVFLDCDLPGISGADVARQYRRLERPGERTPVIATTAFTTTADERRCTEAGMDGFISKPITPEKLRRALGRLAPPPGRPPADPGFDLALLRHVTDGSPSAVAAELAKYLQALDEAVGRVRSAVPGKRAAVASAAHRVLSLARMVGAIDLGDTARDLQEMAAAYSEGELAAEVEALGRHAAGLRAALTGQPVSSCPAS